MLARTLAALVDGCRRRAPALALLALVATGGLGWWAATHLSIDTDTERIISPDLPWRQREAAFEALFPETTSVLAIVIDAESGGRADDAASALAARLREEKQLFKTVRRPEGGDFFVRNGLLFLPVDELQKIVDQLITAQPLIGTIAADPSLRGVFDALGLAVEGVRRGEASLDELEAPLGALAGSIEAAANGTVQPVAWEELFTGREPRPAELRRFVLVQPVLDYSKLQPGSAAIEAVRKAAYDLGLTPENGIVVRLTGSVALSDEEFATVAEGAGSATILSIALVVGILFLALRSWRIIAAVLLTLGAGLIATAAFATVAVGSLNLISVAFAVLFVGIAVDFGIQFSVRFRDERFHNGDLATALRNAAAWIGGPLLLAATAAAVGFFSFVPTNYAGVSELGIIAGTGMAIAFALNVTLLPALLALLNPPGEAEAVGFRFLAPLDKFLLRRRRGVIFAAFCLGAVGIALAPQLRFDFDPLNLKDPRTESVSTLLDLMQDPSTTPYTLDALAPTPTAAAELADRLEKLPQVSQALSISSFVPEHQKEKLAILADAAALLGPTLSPPTTAPPPSDEETMASLRSFASALSAVAGTEEGAAAQLAAALDHAIGEGPSVLPLLRQSIVAGLAHRLQQMRLSLEGASPVSLETLPDELKSSWIARDGRVRVEIFPSGNPRDPAVLKHFVEAVQRVAPEVSGTPVSILESGRTVSNAFLKAGAIAIVAIALLLFFVLRRLRDVALVLAPLVLASLLTVATCVALKLPINYANIIALPLLLGIGVSFDIYFVTAWRAGHDFPLQSPTARAVLFSALTTVAAFGSLAASSHPGTSEMGKLLAIALGWTLLSTLLVLPALLGPSPRR
jgi:hopanoid biosynthesis associated RND transporter like protein HpnN